MSERTTRPGAAGPELRGRAFAEAADQSAFVETLRRFERGEISAEQWRVFRLSYGSYRQRQEGVSMLRVKVPQGVLDGAQLRTLAEVADTRGRGFLHVTTRQNLQLHFLKLEEIAPTLARLADAGLTTKEACGNTVRNITACPLSGVARDEAFDVTPFAEALTRYLLRHPLGAALPRKFKIAFEGCSEDHAFASINDIGFFARRREEAGRSVPGFRVTVGGGTATLPSPGQVIEEFLPAGELLGLAEAIVRVFHRDGDREHRQRARMKYLIRAIGWDAFRERVDEALAEVRRLGLPPLPFDVATPPEERAPARPQGRPMKADDLVRLAATPLRGPGVVPRTPLGLGSSEADRAAWSSTNVKPQKQPGFQVVTVTLPLGDVTSGQLRVLATLAEAYGDGTVRTTIDQNVLLRWIRSRDVASLHAQLVLAGLARPGAGTISDVTSCPGAESCALAVTHSRGLGRLLSEHLTAHPEVAAGAEALQIKISGCPNGCGQHHVAPIGFQGSVRQLGGRALPQYFVLLGGGIENGLPRFGRLAAKIPAWRVPQAVERLLALYRSEARPGEEAAAFLARIEPTRVKTLLAPLESLTADDATPDDFVDPGEAESPAEPQERTA